MSDFPILSLITYLPLLGALIIFFWTKASPRATRQIALWTSIATFAASVVMLIGFDRHDGGMQWTEHLSWLPNVGVNYDMGVDGISLWLVLLTTLTSVIAILWSFDTIDKRVREYFIAMLLLETGMIGVFVALDLFLFYIFFELSLIPMALLIGVWGSQNRVYAAVKFFLYTLAGSLLMLVAIVATYQAYFNETGVHTLNVLELSQGNYGHTFQMWVFPAFFIAFAIKMPLWPFHTWLPDAHVEAPTAGSVILAGVLLKIGGYGLIRFNLPLFEYAAKEYAPYIIILGLIGIIYGALVALVQPDLKKLVAYSSVSHMGFVALGIFAFNQQGLYGAMIVMLSHGLVSAALFLCVGVIYERGHTRLISAFGGLATRMPVYATFFMVFMLSAVGLPGLSGFVGEFLATLGAFQKYYWAGAIAMVVVVLSAWYMMWMFQRVIFMRAAGEPPDPHDNALTPEERGLLPGGHAAPAVSGGSGEDEHGEDHHTAHVPDVAHGEDERLAEGGRELAAAHGVPIWLDLSVKEILTLLPLLLLTIYMGVYPAFFMHYMKPAFEALLAPFGGAGI